MAASTFDRAPLRAATSLEPAKLAVLLYVEEILKLDLPPDLSFNELVGAVRAMNVDEWPEDFHMFCSELHVRTLWSPQAAFLKQCRTMTQG